MIKVGQVYWDNPDEVYMIITSIQLPNIIFIDTVGYEYTEFTHSDIKEWINAEEWVLVQDCKPNPIYDTLMRTIL